MSVVALILILFVDNVIVCKQIYFVAEFKI